MRRIFADRMRELVFTGLRLRRSRMLHLHPTNLTLPPSLLERCMPGRDRTLAESGEPQRDRRQECERSGDVKSKPVILEPVEDPPSNERPEYAGRAPRR